VGALGLLHKQRRSLLKSRQYLRNEAEFVLAELPLELRDRMPDSKAVRPRLGALKRRNRRTQQERECQRAPTRSGTARATNTSVATRASANAGSRVSCSRFSNPAQRGALIRS
jgi:hypothetical protein